jgi:hypothetical protein
MIIIINIFACCNIPFCCCSYNKITRPILKKVGDINSRHGEQDEQCMMDCHVVSSSKHQLIIHFIDSVGDHRLYLEPWKWSYEGCGDGFCKPHVVHDMDAKGSDVIAPPHPPPQTTKDAFRIVVFYQPDTFYKAPCWYDINWLLARYCGWLLLVTYSADTKLPVMDTGYCLAVSIAL